MEPSTTPQESTPKKSLNVSVPAAIVTGAAIIGLAILLSGAPKNPSKTPEQQPQEATSVASDVATVRTEDYVRGSRLADVVVIEYSDSDCPFCKQFHDAMRTTLSTYGTKVSWVYRFFPLDTLHPNAVTEALSLYCVGELGGDEAFWPYLDQIIGVTLSADAKSNEALTTFAVQQGIDASLLSTCMASKEAVARVATDSEEAKKIGARGTPFSVAVNQKTGEQKVIPGAVSAEYMKQIIDSLL